MGTLYDQPPRKHHHEDGRKWLEHMKGLAQESNLSVDQVIAALSVREAIRRNNLYVDNGDIWDEQIAGIGHILRDALDAWSEAQVAPEPEPEVDPPHIQEQIREVERIIIEREWHQWTEVAVGNETMGAILMAIDAFRNTP